MFFECRQKTGSGKEKAVNSENRTRFIQYLGFIAAAVAVGCAVILLFFRTSILAGFVSRLLSLLMPFIYGAVIAYLLHPACLTTERAVRKWKGDAFSDRHAGKIRTFSIILSMAALVLILSLLVMAVVPGLVTSIGKLASSMTLYIRNFQVWISQYEETELGQQVVPYVEQGMETITDRIQSWLQGDLLPNLTTYLSRITGSFSSIMGLVKNFGLGLIISIYLLGSWEKYMAQLELLVHAVFPPGAAAWIDREANYTDRMFGGFITGKLVDSAIVGVICFIFCMITGMPYAILVAVIVGVTNIIPFFGPYLGAVPSAILILTESPVKCLIFVVFIIILQQIDGNLLGPMILGDSVGLSSFWILFAILFFGGLWGLIGMIVGVPVFAVLYDLVSRGVAGGLKRREKTDMLEAYDRTFGREKEETKEKKEGPAKEKK